ncbi:MAG: biopolymer transporter ExbD [Pseudomonadota bacterium]|nr:biopolymer transporter ExbD [Pseudomonadota bacterium]
MAGGGGGEQDLNLVPYMDIMVNLIMFMLVVTAYIIELRQAPVLAPSYSSNPNGGQTEKPKAFLTVAVTSKSIAVLASGDEIPATELVKQDNKYPYEELSQVLRQYKTEYTVAENMVLTADGSVPYSVVVATMDAARGEPNNPLFPGVTLGLAVKK